MLFSFVVHQFNGFFYDCIVIVRNVTVHGEFIVGRDRFWNCEILFGLVVVVVVDLYNVCSLFILFFLGRRSLQYVLVFRILLVTCCFGVHCWPGVAPLDDVDEQAYIIVYFYDQENNQC